MRYSATQYAKALHQLADETPAQKRRELILDFLGTVSKNGSLSLIPEIVREFELSADKDAGIREVVIRTAERVTAQTVSKSLPFKTRVKAEVDVRLKGGAVLEMDDLRVDNSVRIRLARARQAFSK